MKKIFFALLILSQLSILNVFAGNRFNIPGLCYHQVEKNPSGKFSLAKSKFIEQLKYIKKHGYSSVNSDELLDIINSGKPFPNKKVIISFDDGYKSVYTQAFPIMKKMGFKGIACIYPQFIGAGKAMTWQQLKELINNGWSIECHSYKHSNLAKYYTNILKEQSFLHKEMITSRKILKDKLGIEPKLMVWPYGVYTDRTIALAKKAGYAGALTVDGGANYQGINPFFIKRQVIYGTDSLTKFLIRFEMGGINITKQYPQPGQVLHKLSSFTCRLPNLSSYTPKLYKLNVRISRSSCSFKFDPISRVVTGKVKCLNRSGSYFIDVYLRDLKTGITKQNGWLFTIKK